ncbi:hypothetical protein [Mucilaginibacter auburnensis]|uniref:DUF3997 domain-containing protein n=1 Tax=Mucilaginibacter auburnensis TaxID=1457233 RepID=A0A2H9VRK6_9SPHI|nr:hypothetical protein [Mucilaginibacter auburnensis]PJJ83429.1 hypothetical protein CLV57_0411 [Mucilaginibacter auburnensis]
MKSKVKVALFLLVCIFECSGCFGLFDSGSDHIVGDYYTGWIDLHHTRNIYLSHKDSVSVEVVPAYIFAVGHNGQFIFAKQHPLTGTFPNENIDTSITNHYIIRRVSGQIIGPISEHDFEKFLNGIKLSKPLYDLKYPEYY